MLTINAEIRKYKGKSASRRLRFLNKIPAIIYGKFKQPLAIEVDHDVVLNNKMHGNTLIIIINGKEESIVKLKSMQYHPFKPKVTHIDFINA
ncbi:50S ribosomal protein L25 [secondary endosymbiont of Trabutina mannipara]|uniref:Large ribosomal subunit protein bL25 n=1 Tax=secondary endosymbiont of Trabutina mannipara TaxID=1835721 RepID=A0A1C3L435_9ENTR|nr:50S ribosomal protein L25 [secondary endosymbiont of Trabutina mannipara]SBT82036.1 50S ribosomal protein L25 [secondary endosymbiont of Trabutina mannipara]